MFILLYKSYHALHINTDTYIIHKTHTHIHTHSRSHAVFQYTMQIAIAITIKGKYNTTIHT